MMMESNRGLNQALEKSLLWTTRLSPHVFPDFMRIKEMALVEKPNPTMIRAHIHAQILAG